MSPNRLSVTMTSNRSGCVTKNIDAASTCWYSTDTEGNSAASEFNVRCHRSPA